jgi:hypothetical protein
MMDLVIIKINKLIIILTLNLFLNALLYIKINVVFMRKDHLFVEFLDIQKIKINFCPV